MGTSRDDFTKYPRTPHLFGSRGTDDDRHLGERESRAFIANASLIVEEKLDGTGRRLAQLVFWTPALQLLFGNLQLPGPGFIVPVFAVYLLRALFKPAPVAVPAE